MQHTHIMHDPMISLAFSPTSPFTPSQSLPPLPLQLVQLDRIVEFLSSSHMLRHLQPTILRSLGQVRAHALCAFHQTTSHSMLRGTSAAEPACWNCHMHVFQKQQAAGHRFLGVRLVHAS